MDTENCTPVPNRERVDAKLSGKFCSLGKLALHRVDEFHKLQDKPSKHAPCRGLVYRLRPSSILFDDRVLRKLVNESCGVFLSLQSMDKRERETEALKTSRNYRYVVRACVMELHEIAEASDIDEETRKLSVQNRTIFYGIELILHLCEILCIDVAPGSILLPKLLEWLSFHFPVSPQAQRVLDHGMRNPDSPLECHEDFWPSVIGLVLRGRVREAREMLARHSKAKNSPAVITIRQLLQDMPAFKEHAGTTELVDFTNRWQHWQQEVVGHLESGVFSNIQHLQQIAQLLAGQEAALALVHEHSETWYQFLVSYLTYWHPTIEPYQLSEQARKCRRWFGTEDRALDRVLISLFDCDLLQVLKELRQYSESGWAAVHLTDLLYHSGRLNSLDIQEHSSSVSASLREELVTDYAMLLVQHASLWQVALRYLDHCPQHGHALLQVILPSLVTNNTDSRALKVIHEAQTRNLNHVVSNVCTVKGRRALRDGRLGTALTWALRAQDSSLCSTVGDAILRAYALNGSFKVTDLLDNMGTTRFISERLSFLGKYREFHLNYRAEKYKEAAFILMDLVTSACAPPFFLPVLLLDALPLMTQDVLAFSSAEIYQLLAALEELKVLLQLLPEHDKDDILQTLGDKEPLIRLTLAQRLSSSHLLELTTYPSKGRNMV